MWLRNPAQDIKYCPYVKAAQWPMTLDKEKLMKPFFEYERVG